MTWATQGVRCVFYAGVATPQPDVMELWRLLVPQSEPETVQRPRGPIAQATATGTLASAVQISVAVQPGRTDLFFSSPSEIPLSGIGAPAAELVGIAREKVMIALGRFSTSRIALVVDLGRLVDGFEASRDMICSELAFLKLPSDSREVTFQLNRIRRFKIDRAMEMNRLCKWSTAVLQMMAFISLGPGQQSVGATSGVEQRHALLYQIDLSSAHSPVNMLDQGKARAAFGELCDEALTLVDEGYAGLTR